MLSPRHPRRYVQLLRELLALLLSSQASKINSDIVDRAGLQVAEIKEPLRGMFIGPAMFEAGEDDPQGASNRCSQSSDGSNRHSEMQADCTVQFSASRD